MPEPAGDSLLPSAPAGYTGLAAFHKYWGKKPLEYLSFLIETLSEPGDLVADPFLGSGLVGPEALRRRRRFIGIDLNPISMEMARLAVDLPSREEYEEAFARVEAQARGPIC